MGIPVEFLIRAGRVDTVGALREYTTRRLSFSLRRFTPRIRQVTVRLVDVNGPRRGVDSRCSMAAELTDGRRVFVEATTAWPLGAVTQAASRLEAAIGRGGGRRPTYHHRIA